MPARLCRWLLLVCAFAGRAEILDRIAVTVDRAVITESQIVQHIRVAAFLNDEPVELSVESKRTAAGRLVEQALIRHEIEISLYPIPSMEEAEKRLEELKKTEFPDPAGYRGKLAEYGITEDELRQSLLAQLVIGRFIDYRFRPGITVTDQEVRQYYEEEFLPALAQKGLGPPPGLEDSRDQIEQILVSRRVNEALDSWLQRTKSEATIRYREEAFQ
jgi:hypothetical protein